MPTIAAVYLAVTSCSCLIIINWLAFILPRVKKHLPLLNVVASAFRHFIVEPTNGLHIVAHSSCIGARAELTGKINGHDRARTIAVQAGALRTSIRNNIVEAERAACWTKYGVLDVIVYLRIRRVDKMYSAKTVFDYT